VPALAQAETVLHDTLVPEQIFSVSAQWRDKRAEGRWTARPRIDQRWIDLARQGLRRARLQCGDPLICGRDEEAQALAARFRIGPAAPMILVNDQQQAQLAV
jgi:siroheme synthase